MTNAGQNQQSDKATSRRNVMIGGLVAVSTLASLHRDRGERQGRGAAGGGSIKGVRTVSTITTRDGVEVFYKDWGKAGLRRRLTTHAGLSNARTRRLA